MRERRICLFGGTFSPIHKAHLRIAEEAQKRFSLDQVLFIPAANPPHKESAGLAPFEDRWQMVELACEPFPSFRASRLEEGKGRSYTVDTLERFRPQLKSGDELYFLIGADAFGELQTWQRWQEVVTLTKFIVATRPGEDYKIPPGASVLRLEGLDLPVASTTIRARLASGEKTPEVPDSVRHFIQKNGLYGFPRVSSGIAQ